MAIDWEKAMRDAVRSAYAGKGGIFFESNPPPPTPKPRQRTVQLHMNTIAGKGCYEIMMPNGHYLGGADGLPYLLRFKGGLDNEARRELTVEKFQKVYDNFKRLWP